MYKRITELGLRVTECYSTGNFVLAADLEALLEKAVEATGYYHPNGEPQWRTGSNYPVPPTHTALLFNIKLIEKPNPISIKELISDLKFLNIEGLAERIEKWGIKQSGVSESDQK